MNNCTDCGKELGADEGPVVCVGCLNRKVDDLLAAEKRARMNRIHSGNRLRLMAGLEPLPVDGDREGRVCVGEYPHQGW